MYMMLSLTKGVVSYDSAVREGNFKNGVKHGLWVSWNNDDHKKGEETYVNGTLDGLVTVWHDNGNKDREGIIRGNEPEGSWTYYFADGTEDFRFDYGSGLDRVRISELEERDGTFYKIGKNKPYTGIVVESGGLKDYLLLGRFQAGRRDGQCVQWYRNGQKEIEGTYYRGKKNGAWTLWYEAVSYTHLTLPTKA